jgi:hypothetical protein
VSADDHVIRRASAHLEAAIAAARGIVPPDSSTTPGVGPMSAAHRGASANDGGAGDGPAEDSLSEPSTQRRVGEVAPWRAAPPRRRRRWRWTP